MERVHQLLGVVVVHRVGGGDDRGRAAADDDRGRRDDARADVAGRGGRLAGRQDDAAGAHRAPTPACVRQRAAGQLDPRQQRIVAAPAGVGRDVRRCRRPPSAASARGRRRGRVLQHRRLGVVRRRCAAPRWRRSAGRARRSPWPRRRWPPVAGRPCRPRPRGSRCGRRVPAARPRARTPAAARRSGAAAPVVAELGVRRAAARQRGGRRRRRRCRRRAQLAPGRGARTGSGASSRRWRPAPRPGARRRRSCTPSMSGPSVRKSRWRPSAAGAGSWRPSGSISDAHARHDGGEVAGVAGARRAPRTAIAIRSAVPVVAPAGDRSVALRSRSAWRWATSCSRTCTRPAAGSPRSPPRPAPAAPPPPRRDRSRRGRVAGGRVPSTRLSRHRRGSAAAGRRSRRRWRPRRAARVAPAGRPASRRVSSPATTVARAAAGSSPTPQQPAGAPAARSGALRPSRPGRGGRRRRAARSWPARGRSRRAPQQRRGALQHGQASPAPASASSWSSSVVRVSDPGRAQRLERRSNTSRRLRRSRRAARGRGRGCRPPASAADRRPRPIARSTTVEVGEGAARIAVRGPHQGDVQPRSGGVGELPGAPERPLGGGVVNGSLPTPRRPASARPRGTAGRRRGPRGRPAPAPRRRRRRHRPSARSAPARSHGWRGRGRRPRDRLRAGRPGPHAATRAGRQRGHPSAGAPSPAGGRVLDVDLANPAERLVQLPDRAGRVVLDPRLER